MKLSCSVTYCGKLNLTRWLFKLVLAFVLYTPSFAFAVSLCEVEFGGTFVEQMSVSQRILRKIPGLRAVPGIKSERWQQDLGYDHNLFLKLKEELLVGDVDLSSFYDKKLPIELMLASLEVVSSLQNNGLESIEEILTNGTDQQKKALNEQIRWILQTPHLSLAKGDRLIEALYIISNPSLRKRWRLFKRWEPFKHAIRMHIESQISKGDLETVFSRLGILKTNKKLEAFGRYLRINEAKLSWAMTVSASAGLYFATQHYIGQGLVIPVYFPPLKLIKLIRSSDQSLQYVREHGFETYAEHLYSPLYDIRIMPWMLSHTVDQMYGMLRGLGVFAAKSFLAYTLIKHFDSLSFMLAHNEYVKDYALLFAQGGFGLIEKSVQEVNQAILDCQAVFEGQCSPEMIQQIKDFVFDRVR